MRDDNDAWPELATPGWQSTSRTLLLWFQIVGKTRLAFAPWVNHWWHVTQYLNARGLTTSPIPHGSRHFEVQFDFVEHRLEIRASGGETASLALEPGPVAQFYRRFFGALQGLDIAVRIHPQAVEIPESILLDRDPMPRDYDRQWGNRFFRALTRADRLLKQFRGQFIGKCSPVHFFWGSGDLAVTRFSGRRAPLHPGGIPHCPDRVAHEAYSHEVSSAGFWPGSPEFPEAAFYSYAYPEPPGFASAPIAPAAARYDRTLREFILPYASVRTARDPDREVLSFLETTYAAAADLGAWNRRALENHGAESSLEKEQLDELRM